MNKEPLVVRLEYLARTGRCKDGDSCIAVKPNRCDKPDSPYAIFASYFSLMNIDKNLTENDIKAAYKQVFTELTTEQKIDAKCYWAAQLGLCQRRYIEKDEVGKVKLPTYLNQPPFFKGLPPFFEEVKDTTGRHIDFKPLWNYVVNEAQKPKWGSWPLYITRDKDITPARIEKAIELLDTVFFHKSFFATLGKPYKFLPVDKTYHVDRLLTSFRDDLEKLQNKRRVVDTPKKKKLQAEVAQYATDFEHPDPHRMFLIFSGSLDLDAWRENAQGIYAGAIISSSLEKYLREKLVPAFCRFFARNVFNNQLDFVHGARAAHEKDPKAYNIEDISNYLAGVIFGCFRPYTESPYAQYASDASTLFVNAKAHLNTPVLRSELKDFIKYIPITERPEYKAQRKKEEEEAKKKEEERKKMEQEEWLRRLEQTRKRLEDKEQKKKELEERKHRQEEEQKIHRPSAERAKRPHKQQAKRGHPIDEGLRKYTKHYKYAKTSQEILNRADLDNLPSSCLSHANLAAGRCKYDKTSNSCTTPSPYDIYAQFVTKTLYPNAPPSVDIMEKNVDEYQRTHTPAQFKKWICQMTVQLGKAQRRQFPVQRHLLRTNNPHSVRSEAYDKIFESPDDYWFKGTSNYFHPDYKPLWYEVFRRAKETKHWGAWPDGKVWTVDNLEQILTPPRIRRLLYLLDRIFMGDTLFKTLREFGYKLDIKVTEEDRGAYASVTSPRKIHNSATVDSKTLTLSVYLPPWRTVLRSWFKGKDMMIIEGQETRNALEFLCNVLAHELVHVISAVFLGKKLYTGKDKKGRDLAHGRAFQDLSRRIFGQYLHEKFVNWWVAEDRYPPHKSPWRKEE